MKKILLRLVSLMGSLAESWVNSKTVKCFFFQMWDRIVFFSVITGNVFSLTDLIFFKVRGCILLALPVCGSLVKLWCVPSSATRILNSVLLKKNNK